MTIPDQPLAVISTPQIDYPDKSSYHLKKHKEQLLVQTEEGGVKSRYNNVFLSVCSFILFMEISERFAYYMFQTNLSVFITTVLKKPQTSANMYSGLFSTLVFVTPLLGAYVADVLYGRYTTILLFSFIYVTGLAMITFAALPFISQEWLFFLGLFGFICVGAGGIKSNIATLGADQFNPNNPSNLIQLSSFFNWFYWMLNLGTVLACIAGNYALTGYGNLPKEYSYSFSFFIATVLFATSVAVFVFGKKRYIRKPPVGSALLKFFGILFYAAKQASQAKHVIISLFLLCLGIVFDIIIVVTEQTWPTGVSRITALYITFFIFFIGTLILTFGGKNVDWIQVANEKYGQKDTRAAWELLRMLPYLGILIPFWLLHGVMHGIWTNQGCQMDTRLVGDSHINPGSFGLCLALTMCVAIPVCDFYLYPWIARRYPSLKAHGGPSPIQKIGAGYICGMLTVAFSAVLEITRRNTPLARDANGDFIVSICDANANLKSPRHMSAISMWWQLIPYALLGLSEMWCSVTAYDMFYNQVPKTMKSACQGLNLFADAVGAAFNVILQGVLKYHGFLTDDLDNGHQEIYYLSVGIILVLFYFLFLYISRSFEYKDITVDNEEIDGGLDNTPSINLLSSSRMSLHERHTLARISGPSD